MIASLPAALAIEGSCQYLAQGQDALSRVGERAIEGDVRPLRAHFARVSAGSGLATAALSYHLFLLDCWNCHTTNWIEAAEAIQHLDRE